MIPLRDTVSKRRFALVTTALIAANVLVLIHEAALGPRLDRAVQLWGLVPARLVYWTDLGGAPLDPARFLPLFTSMFWHGGILHLAGNMLYLWIFGGSLEDRLGHWRYLAFYFVGGAAAGLTQTLLMPEATFPTVGASGAIAAVLGGYLLSFPRARVVAFVPIIIIPWIVQIPAVVYLVIWFGVQVLSGLHDTGAAAGVAWWAHIGGFLAGLALVKLLEPQRPRRVEVVEHWRA